MDQLKGPANQHSPFSRLQRVFSYSMQHNKWERVGLKLQDGMQLTFTEEVPWPISPIKKPTPSKPKQRLNELEFHDSDTSSDEEYQPEVSMIEQSEDEESFLSSKTSDAESPKAEESTKLTSSSRELEKEQQMGESFPSAEEKPLENEKQERLEDKIALRTRSKLPLNDTPLESIEASFMAPDITIDMYDSECDDEEWREFLGEFLKPLDPNQVDDEVNDPEYNFLEDEDVPDVEDLRDDRGVKVTKKELQELMTELLEAAEAEMAEVEEEEDAHVETTASAEGKSGSERTSNSCGRISSLPADELLFDDARRKQLEEQMRKHVQLLTQSFLLSCKLEDLKHVRSSSLQFLLELQSLAVKSEALYGRKSEFAAYNLEEAVSLVTSYKETPTIGKGRVTGVKQNSSLAKKISNEAMIAISESKVFMYTELLPKSGFRPPIKSKMAFTEAEDNLLAMGLDEFLSLKGSCVKLISEHLLPTKRPSQISIRIKNLRSSKCPDNPVKFFNQHKRLRPLQHPVVQTSEFDPDAVQPPFRQPLELLPAWLQAYLSENRKLEIAGNITPRPLLPASGLTLVDSGHSDIESCLRSTVPPGTPDVNSNVCSVERIQEGAPLTVPRTPEKRATGVPQPRPSPLKRVSPILKKYSSKRLRRTGGHLSPGKPSTGQRKIMPKMVFVNANRPLAPKVTPPPKPPEAILEKEEQEQQQPKTETKVQKVEEDEEGKENRAAGGRGAPLQNRTESDSEVEVFEECEEDTADEDALAPDNEDDLAALMAASTTISKATPRQRQQQNVIKKHQKVKEDRRALAALLACEDVTLCGDDPLKEEREIAFSQAYLQKVKETLGHREETFEEFLRVLHEFNQSGRNVVQLYKDVCHVLGGFPELCDEFVAFLLPEQAFECGKMMEYLTITKMQIFLRKLEIHFGKHPQHIQKIIKVLSQLHQQENPTMEGVKEAVLPLLRGQQHLVQEFLQLFPDEAPSESRMTDFEEICIGGGENETVVTDDDGYEVIHLPDTGDVFGGPDCICDCHSSSEKPKVQNRLKHCLRCGIKFIDGRIFLQTGKVLKPCRVVCVYPQGQEALQETKQTTQEDTAEAVVTPLGGGGGGGDSNKNAEKVDPRESMSSESSLSPSASKDSDEEQNDHHPHRGHPLLEALEQISENQNTATVNFPLPSDAVTEDAILTPDTSANPGTPVPADFSVLRQVIGSTSSSSSSKPVPQTLPSKEDNQSSGRDDEMKEDRLFVSSPVSGPQQPQTSVPAKNLAVDGKGKVVVLWTRDSDRILLQTCQQLGPNKETFSKVASCLESKTAEQVERRFYDLMALFSQQGECQPTSKIVTSSESQLTGQD